MGFPTANINPHHETLPPDGVYAVHGFLGRQDLKGVVHIGSRPTFGQKQKSVEVHFLNFHKNIYGKEIELSFVKLLRPISCFKNAKELSIAIQNDIVSAKILF